jgi:hypothetical protein
MGYTDTTPKLYFSYFIQKINVSQYQYVTCTDIQSAFNLFFPLYIVTDPNDKEALDSNKLCNSSPMRGTRFQLTLHALISNFTEFKYEMAG